MGFKFFSIPGVRPIRGGGKGRALPPIDEIPQAKEWLDSRSPTSHGVLGLEAGMPVDLDLRGEHRQAKVLHEEGDRRSGNASVYVQSEGSNGKEVHRIDFQPGKTAREMIQSDQPKKVVAP